MTQSGRQAVLRATDWPYANIRVVSRRDTPTPQVYRISEWLHAAERYIRSQVGAMLDAAARGR